MVLSAPSYIPQFIDIDLNTTSFINILVGDLAYVSPVVCSPYSSCQVREFYEQDFSVNPVAQPLKFTDTVNLDNQLLTVNRFDTLISFLPTSSKKEFMRRTFYLRVGTFECLKLDEIIIDHLPQNWEIEPSIFLPVDIQILNCVSVTSLNTPRGFANFPILDKNSGLTDFPIFDNTACITKTIEVIDSITSLSIIVV